MSIPLTHTCVLQCPFTDADPFSMPVESPFVSRRRSTSTPIDSCQRHYEHGLARHKASASWESSRCIVPSGASSKMQRQSATTTTLNDAPDTQKWVSYAASHYPTKAASHNPKRASVQSTLPVEYSKKLQPKRQDDASKRSSSGATKQPQLLSPRSPAPQALPLKYVSSGVAFYSRIVAQQQGKTNCKMSSSRSSER